jgi:hypothetical protein
LLLVIEAVGVGVPDGEGVFEKLVVVVDETVVVSLSVELSEAATFFELVGVPEGLKLIVVVSELVALTAGVADGEGDGE